MRRVASYVAQSAIGPNEQPADELGRLHSIVARWCEGKGMAPSAHGAVDGQLTNGKAARLVTDRWESSRGAAWEVVLDEETDAGRFLTRVLLGWREERLWLFLELRAGADGYRVAPVRVDPRCPQVLRELIEARPWQVGATPITAGALGRRGADGGRRFISLVRHADRNLPVVAVSAPREDGWADQLATDLGRDLCGLAIVCSLDEAASWEVTHQAGVEWSCHSGAVRVYWPLRGGTPSAFDHPLWTRDRIRGAATSERDAAARLRAQLRHRILSVSTYSIDEPTELRQTREEAARERFEAVRRQAAEKGDQSALAEHYFNECARLEAANAALAEANAGLQDQVDSLEQVWQHAWQQRTDEDIPPEPAPVLRSVSDAVREAARTFAGDLTFGDDVERGVGELASDAGPPDKVFEHLRTLAEMTCLRRSPAGLGKNALDWLREKGLRASSESQGILSNPAEMKKRTWHDGAATRRFEQHLKPNDGTSPDRCVRIYFAYDEATERTVIGWVGRHP